MRKALTIILAVSVLFMFSIPAMAGDTTTGVIVPVTGDDNQGQGQGQGQSINDNSKNEAMQRGFANPGGVGYGPVINYYGKPLPTSQFRPVETLLQYSSMFTEGALEEIICSGSDTIHELEVVNAKNMQERAKYEDGEPRWIKIIATTEMQKDHGLIGYATCEADDRKTSMLEVIARAALDALREGADVLQITAQGASRDTMTSGWGIGFNASGAKMFDGDNGSAIMSGGTGYSTAWAGMRDKPWIQATALKAPEKIVAGEWAK